MLSIEIFKISGQVSIFSNFLGFDLPNLKNWIWNSTSENKENLILSQSKLPDS